MAKDFFHFVESNFPPRVMEQAQARYQQLRQDMLIRELRESLEITQEQLARKTGIKRPNLSRLERQADMQIGTLKRIIAALGGDVEIIARFGNKRVRVNMP